MNSPLTAQQKLDLVLAAEKERQENGLPADPELVVQRAKWHEKLADYEAALEACDQAEKLIGGSAHHAVGKLGALRGHVYIHTGRYKDAAAELDRTESLLDSHGFPASPEVSMFRGYLLICIGNFNESMSAISRAEELFLEQGQPISPTLVKFRGIVLTYTGKHSEALECFHEVDRLSLKQGLPLSPAVPNNMATALMQLGRYDEALPLLEESEHRHTLQGIAVHPLLKSNMAHLSLLLGRAEDAMVYLDEGELLAKEQQRPNHPLHMVNRGRALCALGRTEEGLENFAESERQYKSLDISLDWQLPFYCAIALYEAGCKDDAISEIYRTILLCGEQNIKPPAFVLETLQDWMAPDPKALVKAQHASQPQAAQPVPDNEKKHDVFICYRRDPGHPYSMLLQAHMEMKHKSVFRDQDGLQSGRFEDGLREAIRYSRHMVVLLTPEFFARCCSDEKDVVRQELATALHCGTHIIPVMMEGFRWPQPGDLPEDIQSITGINAMSYSTEFFTAFIDKLLMWMGE